MDGVLTVVVDDQNSCQEWQNIHTLLDPSLEIIEDDWEIPLDRFVMYPNDFRRCGSQGEVYLGRLSNSPIAVKRVRDSALADIRHLKDLDHKNIIQFKGVSQDPRRNHYFILMEWCNNGTLAQKLHDAHPIISPLNLCDFAQQIACGMEYLHSKNIIHRDLKPSNILLTRNNELKISDFGTHKVFNNKSSVLSKSQAGTYPYMAPEVIRGEPYSFPVDVWSYGVVLWEMFLGLRPYNDLDSSAVVWAVGNNSFHLPIPASFPDGLSFLLKGCWFAKPIERMTFRQICMMLKGASPELRTISKERWPPTQAGWKREARDKLQKHLQFKDDPHEDEVYTLKRAYEELLEQAQKALNRNNRLHLKQQECSMFIARDQREAKKGLEMVSKMERAVLEREKAVSEREQAVSKREQTIIRAESSRDNELNQLREILSVIKDETNRRGIKLECLKQEHVQHGQSSNDNNLVDKSETCESMSTIL